MARFKENSRYTGGIVSKNRSNKQFLVLRQPLNLQPDDGDIFVTVTKELVNRPDLVSTKTYAIPDLWWVIYEFNNINDPLFGLNTGQILRLPQLERVLTAISNLALVQ
jgi:hypothetical protein